MNFDFDPQAVLSLDTVVEASLRPITRPGHRASAYGQGEDLPSHWDQPSRDPIPSAGPMLGEVPPPPRYPPGNNGRFATVVRASKSGTDQYVALKTYRQPRDKKKLGYLIHSLEETLQECREDRTYGYMVTLQEFWAEKDIIYLALDFFPQSGAQFILGQVTGRQFLRKLQPSICRLLCDVGQALMCLHSMGIPHGFITTNNIRMGSDGKFKLCELAHDDELPDRSGVLSPPELVVGHDLYTGNISYQGDVFSIGAVGILLTTWIVAEMRPTSRSDVDSLVGPGKSLYGDKSNAELTAGFRSISKWNATPLSDPLIELLVEMVAANPEERPDAETVVQSAQELYPWTVPVHPFHNAEGDFLFNLVRPRR